MSGPAVFGQPEEGEIPQREINHGDKRGWQTVTSPLLSH